MYPQKELIRLAAHKATLRCVITVRRSQCKRAAVRVAQPLAWLDRMLAVWRKVSPLARVAAVPLGFAIKRTFLPRQNFLSSLVRWGPFVVGMARGLGSMVSSRK